MVVCGEKALEAFEAIDYAVDEGFVAGLERMLARSRAELPALTDRFARISYY